MKTFWQTNPFSVWSAVLTAPNRERQIIKVAAQRDSRFKSMQTSAGFAQDVPACLLNRYTLCLFGCVCGQEGTKQRREEEPRGEDERVKRRNGTRGASVSECPCQVSLYTFQTDPRSVQDKCRHLCGFKFHSWNCVLLFILFPPHPQPFLHRSSFRVSYPPSPPPSYLLSLQASHFPSAPPLPPALLLPASPPPPHRDTSRMMCSLFLLDFWGEMLEMRSWEAVRCQPLLNRKISWSGMEACWGSCSCEKAISEPSVEWVTFSSVWWNNLMLSWSISGEWIPPLSSCSAQQTATYMYVFIYKQYMLFNFCSGLTGLLLLRSKRPKSSPIMRLSSPIMREWLVQCIAVYTSAQWQ